MRSRAAFGAAVCLVMALPGCGSSDQDASVRATFRRGIEQIRTSTSATRLRAELRHTLTGLRAEQGSGKGRRLAIAGFEETLLGVEAQIDFIENDRGEIEAATRDAIKANRHKERGADLLRTAGRELNVTVGRLRGY